MNRVSRTLFRSFLRWTRRPEVVGTNFTLYPRDLGVAHLLPANAVLKGVEGVQGAVYHCFRHNHSQDLDLAFSLMKQLNEFHLKLKEEFEQRRVNRNPMFTQYATYKVGQVVQFKANKVRGVVAGWEVDAALGKQKLQLLLDVTDLDEQAMRLREGLMIKSVDVELVTNPLLHRINNPDISTFFYYFDEGNGRYVPRDQLYQLYPNDFEGLDFAKPLQSEADKKVMQSVTQGIATLGQHLQFILEEEFPSLLLTDEDPRLNQLTDQQMNERIIARQILDEIMQQIQNLITPHPSMKPSTSRRQSNSFAVKLLRGGLHRQAALSTDASPEHPPYYFAESDQIAIETTYGAVFNLQELIRSVHQLLQLRFQSRGLTFVDRLRVKHTEQGEVKIVAEPLANDVESIDKETRLPIPIFEVGQVVRHKKLHYRGVISGFDQRPLVDATKWDGVKDSPLGVNQPFYRVIPDQGDVDEFISTGRYHSYFYIAQDNLELVHDPASLIVNHKNIGRFFVGWDTETSRFRVPHKLKYCFPCGPQSIPEDYPHTSVLTNWLSQQPDSFNLENVKEEDKTMEQLKHEIIHSEIEIYQKVDLVLLELHAQMVSMLSETRVHYAAQTLAKDETDSSSHLHFTVAHLLTLLQKAPTREAAFSLESLLWYVWATHTDANVATAVRLGLSSMNRADRERAIKAYEAAIAHDGQFAEVRH